MLIYTRKSLALCLLPGLRKCCKVLLPLVFILYSKGIKLIIPKLASGWYSDSKSETEKGTVAFAILKLLVSINNPTHT